MISDLLKAGQLLSSYEINGIGATKDGRNGGGDPYFTDGKALNRRASKTCSRPDIQCLRPAGRSSHQR